MKQQPNFDGLAAAKSLYHLEEEVETEKNVASPADKSKIDVVDDQNLQNFFSHPSDSGSKFNTYESVKARLREKNLPPGRYEDELKKIAKRLQI